MRAENLNLFGQVLIDIGEFLQAILARAKDSVKTQTYKDLKRRYKQKHQRRIDIPCRPILERLP